jgi:hypothetical protein
MQVIERFAAQALSEGDRTLLLRALTKQALIRSARLRLTPVDAAGAVGASIDPVTFDAASGGGIAVVNGTGGATKTRFASGAPPWVEIDFHQRRTLVDVSGENLAGTSLQVDFGGTFVEVNQNGAVRVGDGDSVFTLAAGGALPGLAVSRFRLTAPAAAGPVPDVTQVRLRNSASNVTVALDSEPPFWARPGDLVAEVLTADFSEALQAALDQAEQQDGAVEIALLLHSDTPARIDAAVEIEVEELLKPLGPDLPEATLPYAYNGTPEADAALLQVSVPLGSRIKAAGTRASIVGRFDNSRIVHGGLARLDGMAASARIEENLALAQPFSVPADLPVHAVDVLLATDSPAARLQLDLRGDLDGKPDSASLLAGTVVFGIDNKTSPTPRWTSVPLPAPFKATAADALTGGARRYWLVLQSEEAAARWSAVVDSAAPAVRLQQSRDGGMSWREAAVAGLDGAPAVQFRLRQDTAEFDVPIEVEIGEGDAARRLGLGQFRPLGRIDFSLDPEQLADAFNGVLDTAERGQCRPAEHLINGDFALDNSPDAETYLPLAWTPSGGSVRLAGGSGFLIMGTTPESADAVPVSLSQVVPAVAHCSYELTVAGISVAEGGRAELIWRAPGCDVLRTDRLPLPAPATAGVTTGTVSTTVGFTVFGQDQQNPFVPAARLRVTAPQGANQVEVRLLAPATISLLVDYVSLVTAPQTLRNGDLHEVAIGETVSFEGWSFEPPPEDTGFSLLAGVENGRVRLDNDTGLLQPLGLLQRAAATPAASFTLQFIGRSIVEDGAVAPSLRLVWRGDDGAIAGATVERQLAPEAAERQQVKGRVPAGATEAELRLIVPDRTSLVVELVSLEQLANTSVPMVILSAAPGELTLRDFAVAVEPTAPPPIEMPETGLCQPTPANLNPDDVCEIDAKTCHGHGAVEAAAPPSFARRPTGTLTPAERSSLLAGGRDAFVVARRVRALAPARLPVAERGTPSVRVLDGIGPERERQLNATGILTVRDLAELRPSQLEERIGVSERMALAIVNDARRLLGRPALSARPGA